MNNASKALLFRATFLVYFISSVGRVQRKQRRKLGFRGKEETAINIILFTHKNVTKLPILTYCCGILVPRTFLFFHDNENEKLFHLESFTSAVGFQP